MLELKVPPLLVAVIGGSLMWLADRAVPALHVELPARRLAAAGVALTGALILLSGIVSFRQAGTTVNPMQPSSTSSLVTNGIYAWTRNPMYLGFLLLLLAWAIYLSNAAAFIMLPLFVVYMNRFQIRPEERMLASLFGVRYTGYASRVRRWL